MMGDFEKDLSNAFEGAEFAPSEKVWAGVEAGLAPKKKKGIFFMWQTYGVAATLLFLLTMGFLLGDRLFDQSATNPQTEITRNQEDKNNTEQKSTDTQENTSETQKPIEEVKPVDEPSLTNRDLQASNADKDEADSEDLATREALTEQQSDVLTNTSQVAVLVSDEMAETENTQAIEETANLNDDILSLLELPELPEGIATLRAQWELKNLVEPVEIEEGNADAITEETVARGTMLNGSFGGGNFNPNSSVADAMTARAEESFVDSRLLSAQSVVENREEIQLGSIAVGFGVGLELGERWMFRTGLRYAQYRFASTANAYSIENGESLPIYTRVGFDNSEVRLIGDYQITNTIHSVSIPVQFGLRLVNFSNFSTWVNMGLAADYFVNYNIKGDLNFLDTRTVDLSDTDFLNRFNVNVLTGLELNYRLNQKFALSGEVFFRQYIPMNVGEGTYDASPSFFGFGLGVNYYLRKKK